MKYYFAIFFLFIFSMSIFSADELYEKREFVFKGDTLRYRVLFPENYDKNRSYPMVLFLHGSGERGCDNEKQLLHGSEQFIEENNRKDFPSIVIFPQCPEDEYWVEMNRLGNGDFEFPEKPKITKPLFLVKKLLDSYVKTESVDKKRIYVLGISMGGMGTYDLIIRYPKYFAAAVPICGGVNTDRLKKVKKMPIRIFHGGNDLLVSREYSRNAHIELKAEGSQKVEYIEFPGVGHDSWTKAFAYPDFLGWMYYQSR